jgi:hypothetical protein
LQRIEAFEDETAVVTEQLVQSEHSDKENRIIVISLNPLTLAPWTLHRSIIAKARPRIFSSGLLLLEVSPFIAVSGLPLQTKQMPAA